MRPGRVGGPAVEGGVQQVKVIDFHVRQSGGEGKVQLAVQRHRADIGLVGHRQQGDAVILGIQHQIAQGEQLRRVAPCFLRQVQREKVGGAAGGLVATHSPRYVALTSVVGGQRQHPVAVEQAMQVLQVIQRSARGLDDITAAVVPPVLLESVLAPRARDELPQARRTAMGIGIGVERAFHHRQQGDLERHVARFDFLDDVMQVGAGTVGDAVQIRLVPLVPVAGSDDTGMVGIGEREALADAVPDVVMTGAPINPEVLGGFHAAGLGQHTFLKREVGRVVVGLDDDFGVRGDDRHRMRGTAHQNQHQEQ